MLRTLHPAILKILCDKVYLDDTDFRKAAVLERQYSSTTTATDNLKGRLLPVEPYFILFYFIFSFSVVSVST